MVTSPRSFKKSTSSQPVSLFSDHRLPARAGRGRATTGELVPHRLHGEPGRRPGASGPDDAPWTDFVARWLRPALEAQGRDELYLEWRLQLLHESGAVAAQSPFQPLRLQLDGAPSDTLEQGANGSS